MYVDVSTQEEILEKVERAKKFDETKITYLEKLYPNANHENAKAEIETWEITLWVLRNTFRKMNKEMEVKNESQRTY